MDMKRGIGTGEWECEERKMWENEMRKGRRGMESDPPARKESRVDPGRCTPERKVIDEPIRLLGGGGNSMNFPTRVRRPQGRGGGGMKGNRRLGSFQAMFVHLRSKRGNGVRVWHRLITLPRCI